MPHEVPLVAPAQVRLDVAAVLVGVHAGGGSGLGSRDSGFGIRAPSRLPPPAFYFLFLSQTILSPCSVRSRSTASTTSVSGAITSARPPVATQ